MTTEDDKKRLPEADLGNEWKERDPGRPFEVRFRRKGVVEVTKKFPAEDVPEELKPEENYDGIDLTGYPVIFVNTSRHGYERGLEAHQKAPSTICVYRSEGRLGWDNGVLLPENFDQKRVRFYRPKDQTERELAANVEISARALVEEIRTKWEGFWVQLNTQKDGVEVYFEQEVFSMNWNAKATTVEQARVEVEKKMPMWREWNERGLEVFMRHSGKEENPGKGNVELKPSPEGARTVGIHVYPKKYWVILELQSDGTWLETRTESENERGGWN